MLRLTSIFIVLSSFAAVCHAASITLPETGQTSCYNAAGSEMACSGTGQDGALLKGTAWPMPRFTDNGSGTVTDKLTGLTWLKDLTCFAARNWTSAMDSAASLSSGSCGLTDGSLAGQWRLPNRKELMSLVNRQEASTATWLVSQNQGFAGVQTNYYWSSSTFAASATSAWCVNMGGGDVSVIDKTSNYFVMPVRTAQ